MEAPNGSKMVTSSLPIGASPAGKTAPGMDPSKSDQAMTQAKMGRAAGGNSNKAGKGTNSTANKQQPPPAGVSARNAQGGRKRGGGAAKKMEAQDAQQNFMDLAQGYGYGAPMADGGNFPLAPGVDYHMGKHNGPGNLPNYMQQHQYRNHQMAHMPPQNHNPLPHHMHQQLNHNYMNMMHPGGPMPPQMAGMVPLSHGMMMGPPMHANMMMMHMHQMGGTMGAHGMGGNDLAGAGGASANDFQQDPRRPHNMSPVGPGQLHHYPHAQQHRFNHHGHGQQRGIHQGFAHKGGSQQDKRQSGKAAQEMRTDDLMRASSPMLTRILVDMLREGEAGKARAWVFFEKICNLNKADVYQYSVMLNACSDSYASEKLMQKMGAAGIQPSEVTYQKLYKIYLRDARVEEADQVLKKMREVMQADGTSGLPADYTNRVLTDMLLEMVKEGNQAEERAWVLFNRLRSTSQVNVIHYNVMLNTCKTTSQAVQLVKQAQDAGIAPSERTCLKLAKMYIKEGSMPCHPGQLEAVVKGLKKTTLFSGSLGIKDAGAAQALAAGEGSVDVDLEGAEAAGLEVESREFVPGVPFSDKKDKDGSTPPDALGGGGEASEQELEVARMLQSLLVQPKDGAPEEGGRRRSRGGGGKSSGGADGQRSAATADAGAK